MALEKYVGLLRRPNILPFWRVYSMRRAQGGSCCYPKGDRRAGRSVNVAGLQWPGIDMRKRKGWARNECKGEFFDYSMGVSATPTA